MSLLNFVSGLGAGLVKGGQYADEQNRLDRQEALRMQEFEMRKRDADYLQAQRDKADAIEKIQADVGGAGKVEQGGAVATEGGQAFYQPDAAAAQAAIDQARAEGDTTNYTAQQAQSVRGLDGQRKLFTGMNAAGQAADYAKANPISGYAREMAMAERLSAMPGGRKAAMESLERARTLRAEGVGDALALLDAGKPEEAAKLFNSTGAIQLPEGQRFVTTRGVDPVTKTPKLTHSVVDADGNVVVPDVRSAAYNYILPLKDRLTLEGQATRASDLSDVKRELALMRAGGSLGGSGASGSKGGKVEAPKTALEQAHSILMESTKTAGTNGGLNADQLVSAQRWAGEISRFDPNLPPDQIAGVAAAIARDGMGKNIVPSIDLASGRVVAAYVDPDTNRRTALHELSPSKITPEAKKQLGSEVSRMVQMFDGQMPGAGNLYRRAAFGDRQAEFDLGGKLAEANADAMARQLEQAGRPVPDRATLMAAAAKKVQQDAPKLQRQFDLIREFGEPVKQEAPGNTQRGAAPSAAAAPTGSAVPEYARVKAAEAEQARKAKEQEQLQADAARLKARKEAEAKVAGLTPEMAWALTPQDAAQLYRQYGGVIKNAFVREALESRMSARP